MTSIYSGDPALFLTKHGADMKFIGGQPIMDAGLENAAKISLFTREGWIGNFFVDDINKKIGSKFEKENEKAITINTLNDRRDAAEKALDWFLTTGLSSKNNVDLLNQNANIVDYTILIIPPGKDQNKLLLTTNGINWIEQKINPVNRKI